MRRSSRRFCRRRVVIDSHCHFDVAAFEEDRDAALARAAAVGVEALVVPAVDPASWTPIARLALHAGPVRCYAALGVHPVALPELPQEGDDAMLEALARSCGEHRPVAVGECGLDTTIDLARAPLERQERVLQAQLAVARTLSLPVILHARGPGCYERLLDFLRAEPLPERGGVVHSYGGGIDFLKRYLALPLLFGFAGPATYPNARKVRTSIAAVPDDRLLAETDAPDQTPAPHRPARNEPAYLREIVAGIAAARGTSPEAVAELTAGNARRLFDLP